MTFTVPSRPSKSQILNRKKVFTIHHNFPNLGFPISKSGCAPSHVSIVQSCLAYTKVFDQSIFHLRVLLLSILKENWLSRLNYFVWLIRLTYIVVPYYLLYCVTNICAVAPVIVYVLHFTVPSTPINSWILFGSVSHKEESVIILYIRCVRELDGCLVHDA